MTDVTASREGRHINIDTFMPIIQNLYNCFAKTRMGLLILKKVREVSHVALPFSHCSAKYVPVFPEQCHTGGILHDLDTSVSEELAMWGGDQIHTWHAIDEGHGEEFDMLFQRHPTEHESGRPQYGVEEVTTISNYKHFVL
jgi:hypothetical protein